jgi:RNA polymerase sigma factor (sigma-70 family)
MHQLSDHLQLVARVARQFHRRLPRSVSFEELIADGLVGLWQATRTFDHWRNVPFHRFAVRRIRGAMQDGLRERDWAQRSMRESEGTINVPRVPALGRVQLDQLIDPRARAPDQVLSERATRQLIRHLPRRARLALLLYFLEGLNMKATGQVFAMTEAGASLLIKRTLRSLAAAATPRSSSRVSLNHPNASRGRGG